MRIVAENAGDRPIVTHPIHWSGVTGCVLDGVIMNLVRFFSISSSKVEIKNLKFTRTNTGSESIQLDVMSELLMSDSELEVTAVIGTLPGIASRKLSRAVYKNVIFRNFGAVLNTREGSEARLNGITVANSGYILAIDAARNIALTDEVTWLDTPETYSPTKNVIGNRNAINSIQ